VPRLSQTRAYVALLLIAALWGTFPATSKLALDDLPPTLLTAVRAIVASAFLVALLVRSGADAVRPPAPETLRAFVVLGVAGVVLSMHIAYWGIYTTTAANAAILQAASPVMIALGARLYLGERLRRRRLDLVRSPAFREHDRSAVPVRRRHRGEVHDIGPSRPQDLGDP